MKWVFIVALIVFLYWSIIVKAGNRKFWKIANSNPEDAYRFFDSSHYFTVFIDKPSGGYRNALPDGDWDGPFKMYVPSIGKSVTIYGQVPEYEAEQEEFLRSVQ